MPSELLSPVVSGHSEASAMVEQRVAETAVERRNGSGGIQDRDLLAVEEALEIRLVYGTAEQRVGKSITVTMRTPGSDRELAAGFLFAEGLVRCPEDVVSIRHCGPPAGPLRLRNVVRVELRPGANVDATRLERNFLSTSSCGVCGKASLEALPTLRRTRLSDGLVVAAAAIHRLPDMLRQAQTVFDCTGGLHAAALFDRDGRLHDVKEDVGRHNALDKLGGALARKNIAARNGMVVFTSRVSVEMIQKAAALDAPVVVAVSAPTALAVRTANAAGITLVAVARNDGFEVFTHPQRVAMEAVADVA